MAHIKNNDIIITQKEANYYNAKLDLITTPQEWILIAKELYLSVDIQFEIDWSPSFTQFKDCNKVIPCFKGPVSGKNIDISGKKRSEVYSFTGITKDMSFFNNILRIQTGSGGGGANWRYNYAYLDVRKFPAMLEKYGRDITDTFIKQQELTCQAAYDYELQEIQHKINNTLNSYEWSPEARKIKDLHRDLDKAKKALDHAYKELEKVHIKKAFPDLVIPTCDSPFISLTNYNRLVSTLATNPFALVEYKKTTAKAQKIYDEVVRDYPEYYI